MCDLTIVIYVKKTGVTGLWTMTIYIDEDFDLCMNLNHDFMIMIFMFVFCMLTVDGLLRFIRTTKINQ